MAIPGTTTESTSPISAEPPNAALHRIAPLSPARGAERTLGLVAAIGLVFGQHALLGVNDATLALVAAGAQAALLCMVFLSERSRRALGRVPALALPAALFGLVLLLALWSISSLAPVAARAADAPIGGGLRGAVDPASTLIEVVKLSGLACLFLVGAALGGSPARLQRLLADLSIAGLLYLAVTLLMFAASTTELYGAEKFISVDRFTASFVSANTAATVIGQLFLLAWTRMLFSDLGASASASAQDWARRRLVEIALAALALLGLVLTASRAGALFTAACAVGIVLASLRRARRTNVRGPLVLVLSLLGCALVLLLPGVTLNERLALLGDDTSVRSDLFWAHWTAIRAAWAWGYGLGSFELVNNALITPHTFGLLAPIGALHNVYLQWLEQAGVFGFAPMALCLAIVLGRITERATVAADPAEAGAFWAVLACSGLLLLHGTVDYALEVPSVAAMWALLLGCAYATSPSGRRRRRRRERVSVEGATSVPPA